MFSAIRTAIFASMMLVGFSTILTTQALATSTGAEKATELLARAQAVQQKCKFLNASQTEELSSFVARAEIAMVSKSSTKYAKSIIANGRALGKKAACSDLERTDAIDIINAARQATSGIKQASAKPIQVEKPEPVIVKVKKSTPEPRQKPARTDGLAQYAQLTKRYYLARRCNAMSYNAISSLYRNVVVTHRNVVANFGVPAVRNIMQQSEQRANQSSCS